MRFVMKLLADAIAVLKGCIYGSTVFFTGKLTESTDFLDVLALRFLLSFFVMWFLKTTRILKIKVGVKDFFVKNDKDIPEFILNSEINVDKFNTIFNIYNDKTRTVTVQKDIKENPWHYWEFKFKEGEALFLMNFPCNLYAFVEMEQDFSILPMPKYNEAQENYRTMTSVWFTSCIVVPKVFDAKPEDIGLVIDALSFLGKLPLTYATTAVMLFFTLKSGIDYMIAYREFLNPNK